VPPHPRFRIDSWCVLHATTSQPDSRGSKTRSVGVHGWHCSQERIQGAHCWRHRESRPHSVITTRTLPLAKAMPLVKGASSHCMNEMFKTEFAWPQGYGAFTVGTSQKSDTVAYLKGQAQHHRQRNFEEEFLAILDEERGGIRSATRMGIVSDIPTGCNQDCRRHPILGMARCPISRVLCENVGILSHSIQRLFPLPPRLPPPMHPQPLLWILAHVILNHLGKPLRVGDDVHLQIPSPHQLHRRIKPQPVLS